MFKEIDITPEERKILVDSINRKMAPQPMKLRADFELTCFNYEGIDALRAAMLSAKHKINSKDEKI